MSRRNKWPAKALNLLVALAMVISLCAVFAPAVAAQSYNPDCNPVEEWTPCHQEVFLNTYIKDANGDFTAEDTFSVCQSFYVNAVVVNTGNGTADAPITATINLGGLDVSRVLCAGNDATQTSDEPLAKGEMVDFWWLVHCDAGTGWQTITVDVMDGGEACPASGQIDVYQTVSAPDRCVEIEIIEAPGLNSALPQTVVPCTNFGIKANITNNCSYELNDVNGTIRWGQDYDAGSDTFLGGEDTALDGAYASLVGGDPLEWCVGDLAPNEWAIVAWTMHCDAPGDIEVLVQAKENACGPSGDSLHERTNYTHDPWTVHQLGAGEVVVDITWPPDGYEVCQGCTIHGLNEFTVDATVTNSSDVQADGVYVIIVGNDTSLFNYKSSTMVTIGDMIPGASAPVSFDLSCKAPGALKFTVTAYFTTTEGPGTAEDTVLVDQKNVIATVQEVSARDPAAAYVVNVCNTFDVIGSFRNCTGEDLTYVNVCIIWFDSDATLILNDTVTNPDLTMNPVYDRCLGAGWHRFDGVETGTEVLSKVIVPLGLGWFMNCQKVAICDCCETRVRWTFQCVDDGDVTARVYMTKTVGPDTWTDESDNVIIDQVWKAHLIGGAASYLQNECGAMLQRDAFAPCQDFHVVMPVANVGDADAEMVMVNFAVIAEEGVYDVDDIVSVVSGDLMTPTSYTFDPATGLGTATIGTIPGDSARKVILHMHCAGEGDAQFLITGITGIDQNTGKAIDPDNIELPPCPITVEQIPFTVEIINPTTCETFNQYDRFAVKALITNGSDTDLGTDVAGVWAELFWTGNADLVSPQNNPKRLGNATDWIVAAKSVHEVTWEMECTGPGEVHLSVTVTSEDPLLTTESDTVTVHQTDLPNIQVEILSPAENTYVATSQEFAVTARVNNSGAAAAQNVSVTASSQWGLTSLTESATKYYNDNPVNQMAAGAEWIVTWTLHADKTFQKQCGFDYDQIGVYAATSSTEVAIDDNDDYVYVYVYPAAHLVVDIDYEEMPTTIGVRDEFVVPYTVTNTGEADAWEASVTLSVIPEGSVRIAAGDEGYTQYIGTLAGWETGDSYEGTFTLHCKQACESTITITPAGQDECGFTMVECDLDSYQYQYGYGSDYWEYMYGPYYWYDYIYCDWEWIPGADIRDMFLEPDSVTVKQLDSGDLDLAVTKTVDDAYPDIEQVVTFTVRVTNNGPTDASGIEVTDAQPSGLTFGTAVPSKGTYSAGVWNVGSLVAGGSATLTIPATVNSASAVTNTATITDVDQPDGDPANDSASVTLNEPAVTSLPIGLDAGWNLISLPLIPNDNDLETMLAPVWGDFIRAFKYDGCTETWSSYIKDGPTPSLTTLDDGFGYWILMDDDGTITVSGVVALDPPNLPPSYDVCAGWDLIGFKSTDEMTAGVYLDALRSEAGVLTWTSVWGFANGDWVKVFSADMMEPGFGYWLAVLQDGTIYP